MNRRSFFSALGGVPVIAPAVPKPPVLFAKIMAPIACECGYAMKSVYSRDMFEVCECVNRRCRFFRMSFKVPSFQIERV